MAKVKAATVYQRKFRKSHPDVDKNYRKNHWILRISFTKAEGDRLQKIFGLELHQVAKRLIRVELLKREFMKSDGESDHSPSAATV